MVHHAFGRPQRESVKECRDNEESKDGVSTVAGPPASTVKIRVALAAPAVVALVALAARE
jgi:hypothetical protein